MLPGVQYYNNTIGVNIDADHPKGDLNRISHSSTQVGFENIIGRYISFLLESIQLKRNASWDNSNNKSYFSCVLSKSQLQDINLRLLNLANEKILFKNEIESIPSVIEDTQLSNIAYGIKEFLHDNGYFLLSSDFPHEVVITDDIDGSQVRNLAENNEIVHHVYLEKYHHETSPDKDITVVDNATFGDAPIGYSGVDISRYNYDQFHEIYEEEHFATSEYKDGAYVWKSYYGSSSEIKSTSNSSFIFEFSGQLDGIQYVTPMFRLSMGYSGKRASQQSSENHAYYTVVSPKIRYQIQHRYKVVDGKAVWYYGVSIPQSDIASMFNLAKSVLLRDDMDPRDGQPDGDNCYTRRSVYIDGISWMMTLNDLYYLI